MNISTKTKWIASDGWRGRLVPINAVGGANDTGEEPDSPCPTHVAKAEIRAFTKKLRAASIPYKIHRTRSSNVFMQPIFVLTAPEYHEQARAIAKKHRDETRLFYMEDCT